MNKILNKRKELKLTHQDVVIKTNGKITFSTLSRWERGHEPNLGKLKILAEAYGCTVNELV